jgi:CheY-like chemotaxis protein
MARLPFKILYVGHDRAVRRRLIQLLERAGYAVKLESVPARSIKRTPGAFEFVVYDDTDPRETTHRLSPSNGSKVARRRVTVLTAETTAPRQTTNVRRSNEVVMSLRGLRESVGATQREMAVKTLMTQSQLSRVETRRDHLISTLKTYVEALGGDVRVIAVMDGLQVSLEKV